MLPSNHVMDYIRAAVAFRGIAASFQGDFAMNDRMTISVDRHPHCKLTARRIHCGYQFEMSIAGVLVYHEHGTVVSTHSGRVLRLSPAAHAYATRR